MTILMLLPREETAILFPPHTGRQRHTWHNSTGMRDDKSLTRLHFPGKIAAKCECRLPAAQAHHVRRVLRLKPGAKLTLFNGEGNEHDAVILCVAHSGVTVRVGPRREVDRESRLRVVLAQAVSAGERMDYTVQKAVELGVAAIQPVVSSRSVVRLDSERGARRVAHWQAVAVAACEQCGRNRVPLVEPLLSLPRWLAAGARQGVLLSPTGALRLSDLPQPQAPLTLLAGPEGGFAPEEYAAAERAGFAAVKLGPRVLRTETAAVAALAAMQALWGDF
jgi:16S rRNA (uracil1498-N3)-methyltransferase